jgi:hypothetical protein
MYPNIPKTQVMQIINSICYNMGFASNIISGINALVKEILEQNCFTHNNIIYQQTKGLAMGAPTSSIFSEVFIQYLEHTQRVNILAKHNDVMYHRYVDDILIVYNNASSNIDDLLTKFNSLHPDIQFKLERETENRLNFLDLIIHRMQDKLQYDIYRKPTATDIMIHSESCHPREHKWSGISHLVNHLNTYPLTNINGEKKHNRTHVSG